MKTSATKVKKVKKVAKQSTEIISEPYKVTLTMAGNDYESTGENIDRALEKLALTWEKIKAKGVVRVEHEKSMVEKLFYPKQLKMIFANKLTRFMWAKRLQLLLKETAAMLGGHI